MTRLHRAIALRYTDGPRAATGRARHARRARWTGYHLFHATRAELLRAVGQHDRARDADQRALDLTANPAERALLRRRITWP